MALGRLARLASGNATAWPAKGGFAPASQELRELAYEGDLALLRLEEW
jgi:hypothetical protein